MDVNKPAFKTTDEYIKQFSPEVQELLTKVRNVIKEAVPKQRRRLVTKCRPFICMRI